MQVQSFEKVKKRNRKPTPLIKADWLISAGGIFQGNVWTGRRYLILVKLKGRRKPLVIPSSMPYDKMVDAAGNLFTDVDTAILKRMNG